MTLPQVNELMAYWKDHPPLHELAAAYLGYKRKPEDATAPFRKISPTRGDIRPATVRPAQPANDMGALVGLAQKRGGDVRLEDLMGWPIR